MFVKRCKYLIILFILQSCISVYRIDEPVDCSNSDQELISRYSLFKDLSSEEINRRKFVDLSFVSPLDKPSVFSKIIDSMNSTAPNSPLIAVDLRYYNDVSLGNIIISNISNDKLLNIYFKTSKFSQGTFALINFGKENITLVPPLILPSSVNKSFSRVKIDRKDLRNAELVINVSNSNYISGNMKFAKDQKISLIADNISKPYGLDLREASNLQYHFNKKWIMPLYSISGSSLTGGKKTNGFFRLVNNKDVKNITLHKFNRSLVACYTDPLGLKF